MQSSPATTSTAAIAARPSWSISHETGQDRARRRAQDVGEIEERGAHTAVAVGLDAELGEVWQQRAPAPCHQIDHQHGDADDTAIEPGKMVEQRQEQEAD